jgi:N-acetylmuramoyl-L-alanine amidase
MAMYKIYLSPSSQPENKYAVGDTTEDVQCAKIAKACEACLKSILTDTQEPVFEVKVGANTGGVTMTTRMTESNAWKANIHVPIHTNAGGGGTVSGRPIVLTKSLNTTDSNYIVSNYIYQALREVVGKDEYGGVKSEKSFHEIANAEKLVSYCECEFHDSERGASTIINYYAEIGKAIASGICSYYKATDPNFPQDVSLPDNVEALMNGGSIGSMVTAEPVKITTATPEAYPDPAQNITLSTDVTLRNGNFSYSFDLPKKEGFGYYYNRATFKNGVSKECGYTTFLVVNNTEIIQLDKVTLREDSIQEDSTTRVSGRFVLKDKLSNADLNKLKVADSIQFGVKTYVKKPDKSILYSYVIPHASNSICLRVNNYNIIINPYNKD